MPTAPEKSEVYGREFAELVSELGLEVSGDLLPALQAAQGFKDERVRRGQEDYGRSGLTRTVVLLGCLATNDEVEKALLSSGLAVAALLDDIGLDTLEVPAETGATNFTLHPQVAGAVHIFQSEFRGDLALDAPGLCWALMVVEGSFLERLSRAGLDVEAARAALRSRLRSRMSGVNKAAPVDPEASRARIARYLADGLDDDDQLGIRAHVDAMASVIASKDMEPPLAVGLFGRWGSGKSFFMKQLERAVEARCAATRATGNDASPFVSDVVPIWFNAWHYMDASLWPSLVVHIFNALAEHINRDDPDEARAKLFEEVELARGKVRAAENDHETVQAALTAEQRHLEQTLKRVRAARPTRRHDMEVLSEKRPTAMAELLRLAGELEMPIQGTNRPLNEIAGEVEEALQNLLDLRGRVLGLVQGKLPGMGFAAWASVVTLVGIAVAAALWWLADRLGWNWDMFDSVASWLGVVATTVFTKLTQVGRKARELSARWDSIKSAQLSAEKEEEEQRRERLKALREEARQSREQVLNLKRELARAQQRVEETKSGYMLERFIQERSQSDDYRQNLGVIAKIREDFRRLEELFLGSRTEALAGSEAKRSGENPLPNVDRIVLYIDDLDRCPRERVVDVIQAVHLLLALRLFVVVVAIDPRWLHSSLRGSNSEALESLKLHIEADDDDHEEGPNDGRATALNYLEKIFQIPFTLGEMGQQPYRDLIEHLTHPVRDESNGRAEPPKAAPTPATRRSSQIGGAAKHAPPPNADDSKRTAQSVLDEPMQGEGESGSPPNPRNTSKGSSQTVQAAPKLAGALTDALLDAEPVSLSEQERNYLAAMGPPILRTPRAAKRLVNSYRVLRAATHQQLRTAPTTRKQQVGTRPADECAIVLLALAIAFPGRAGKIFVALDRADPDSDWVSVIAESLQDRPEVLKALAELPLDSKNAGSFAETVPHVRRYSFFT